MTERLKKAMVANVEHGLSLRRALKAQEDARVLLVTADKAVQEAQATNSRAQLELEIALNVEALASAT